MLTNNRAYIESAHAARLVSRRRLSAERGRVVRAASMGDVVAWRTLTRQFGARLSAVVRAHRLAAHDAEDVIQTSWLWLLEHIHALRDPVAVGAWLETTARRESVRTLRMRQGQDPTDVQHLADQPIEDVAGQRLIATEQRTAAASAVGSLSERDRRLVSMLFAEPASRYDEVSRALDMPVGSIGPTRARILARLRQHPAIVSTVDHAD